MYEHRVSWLYQQVLTHRLLFMSGSACLLLLQASGWDEATFVKKQAIELNNGRAAQMGILALMVHEKLDNNPYIINSLLGAPVDFNAGF